MVSKGDVVQANENAKEWCGCLLIVSEVKPWGVLAGMKIPHQGTAYIRLRHKDYEVIGPSVFVEREDED